MKNGIKILLMILGLLLVVRADVWAVDLTVTCAEDGPCDMAPAPGTALFDESNILPGDSFVQSVEVINEDENDACDLVMTSYNETQSPATFAQQLFTAIEKDGSLIWGALVGPGEADSDQTLQDIYDATFIDMGAVPAAGSVSYDWTVTFDFLAGNEYQGAETVFDFDLAFSCLGEQEPLLSLSKSNNLGGASTSPGGSVIYTLTLNALGDVGGVQVIDLPPEGFDYQGGSWTAFSDVRGDLKGGVTGEPTYASPGTWNVGDMVEGEEVVLTYVADISSDQLAGVYPDLAWAYGDSDGEVLANADSGVFVGTDVEVVRNELGSLAYEVESEGQVLGATTEELPATGGSVWWLVLAVVMVVSGGILIRSAQKEKRA